VWVVTLDEVREADYNLSPSLFVETNDKADHRLLSAIISDLRAASIEREAADRQLTEMLIQIGVLRRESQA
jgi:type I restriction enzyme M protein